MLCLKKECENLVISLSMSSLRPHEGPAGAEKAVARIVLVDGTAIEKSIHWMTQVIWKHSSVSFHLPNSDLWFQIAQWFTPGFVGLNTSLDFVWHKSTSLALAKSRHGHHVLSSFSFLLGHLLLCKGHQLLSFFWFRVTQEISSKGLHEQRKSRLTRFSKNLLSCSTTWTIQTVKIRFFCDLFDLNDYV